MEIEWDENWQDERCDCPECRRERYREFYRSRGLPLRTTALLSPTQELMAQRMIEQAYAADT